MSLILMGLAIPAATQNAVPPATQNAVPPIEEPAMTAEGGTATAEGPTTATLETASEPVVPAEATTGTLKLLGELEAANEKHASVHAVFKQTRVDDTFEEKIESQGELWFRKPNHFRVDYNDNEPVVTLINEEAFYLYTPSLEQVSFYKFENEEERQRQLHHLLLGFGFKAEELLRLYEVHSSEDEPGPLAELNEAGLNPEKTALLTFRPRGEHAQTSPFDELKLYIDKGSRLPEKIWYRDPNNASMALTMQKIETDAKLGDNLFDRERLFPKGVTMVDQRNTQ